MSDQLDDLDRQLRSVATGARASVSVSAQETEAALAEVTSGAHVTRLRPVVIPERGGPRVWLAVAAATALVATGGIWLLTRGPEKITTTQPTVPAPSPTAVVSVAPTPPSETLTTTPATATSPATQPATATIPSSTPESTAAAGPPDTTVPELDLGAALAGMSWESTPIERVCGDVWREQLQGEQRRCTELVVDPNGVPVTFDPVSRTVTRERREGGEPVAFTLPEEYVDPALLAAGPDEVVYFSLDNGFPEAAGVVAFSLAAGDAGRLIERFPEALGGGDADVLPTETGLVLSGWYNPGFRPGEEALAVPWVSRTGDAAPVVASGAFDDAGSQVSANGWQWSIADRTVRPDQPGTSRVVPTFDGGFIALYSEGIGDLRAELIRGWRDGTVEYVQLPVSWYEFDGVLVLEPQGTVLVPNGDRFARLAPFAERATGWDGRLEIDVEAGTASAVGLDQYLDTIEWPVEGQSHVWPWGLSPRAFANAVAGPLDSPATLRTIEEGPIDATSAVITVTDEGFLDDSVAGTRLTFHISTDQPGFRIERIEWANTCQPGRGHQDYQAAYCV